MKNFKGFPAHELKRTKGKGQYIMEQELQYSAHRKPATLFNFLEGAKAFTWSNPLLQTRFSSPSPTKLAMKALNIMRC
jgi:hypothetical protein